MSTQLYFVKELQTHLKELGFYTDEIDGIAGSKTKSAYKDMIAAFASCAINCKTAEKPETGSEKLRWGSKVSKTFRERVLWMRDALRYAS